MKITVEEALNFFLEKNEKIVCMKFFKKELRKNFIPRSKEKRFFLLDFLEENKLEYARKGKMPIIWTEEKIYVFIQDFEYNIDYVVVKRNPK